ncbi:hypothetical protein B0A49_05957 [Cryomyces minteri]|uniref:Uncharacterized protein n=1 Tax=Cryomyces minteri TaxID=331657 RepID=A0A4U0WYU8_9PEZI|nr:hypothetical protein B0A49_05957 [Cryomyces minteri]
MLRTFAEATSELHKLQFSKASALYFNDNDDTNHLTIELSYRAREEDFGLMRIYVTFELQISSRHMESAAESPNGVSPGNIIQETFAPYHPDLDSQNILVNDEGNNTGILD